MSLFIVFMLVAAIIAIISIFVEFPKWINVWGALVALAFVLSGVHFPR